MSIADLLNKIIDIVQEQNKLLKEHKIEEYGLLANDFDTLRNNIDAVRNSGIEYTEEDKKKLEIIRGIHDENIKLFNEEFNNLKIEIGNMNKRNRANKVYRGIYDTSNEAGVFIDTK